MNRSHFAYKPCISFTNLASGVQNWRFVYKYSLFNLQTSISSYKLAPRITTQPALAILRKKKQKEEEDDDLQADEAEAEDTEKQRRDDQGEKA